MEMVEFQGEKNPTVSQKNMFHEFQPSGKDIISTAPVPTPPPHKVNGKVNRNVIMPFLTWMFLPGVQKHSRKVRQWFLSDGTKCNGDGFLSSLLCVLKDKRERDICSCIYACAHICMHRPLSTFPFQDLCLDIVLFLGNYGALSS